MPPRPGGRGVTMRRREFCKIVGAGLVMPGFLFGSAGSSLPMPMLGRPREDAMTISLLADADVLDAACRCRPEAGGAWIKAAETVLLGDGLVETRFAGLSPGTKYRYGAVLRQGGREPVELSGMFATRPEAGAAFTAALISDMHLLPRQNGRTALCRAACSAAQAHGADFAILLGDCFQAQSSHGGPMTSDAMGATLYRLLRSGLGELPGTCPVFQVNGNWDGENGWHSEAERARARSARMRFMPNPGPATYPQGGSPHEDYYAFAWSDALCVVLNVTGYTARDHAIGSPVGRADDWTLGHMQFSWLERVLSESGEPFKFLFLHHTVGGNGADEMNSRYGRGGGRAAHVGEQARVHELMRRHGVQALFYGHDHVFTDMVVDGIHYTCVGSAGAPWLFDGDVTGYGWSVREPGLTLLHCDGETATVRFVALDGSPAGRVVHTYSMAAN